MTWTIERIATWRRIERARAGEARMIAAAPSLISEQSVSRRGAAISGLLGDTWLQCSKSITRCICASGLAMALAWFFTAIAAIDASGLW